MPSPLVLIISRCNCSLVSSHADEGGGERCTVYKQGTDSVSVPLLFPQLASASLLSHLHPPTPLKWPSLEDGKLRPKRDMMPSASCSVRQTPSNEQHILLLCHLRFSGLICAIITSLSFFSLSLFRYPR